MPGADERTGQPQRPARQPQLLAPGLVVLGEQPAQHGNASSARDRTLTSIALSTRIRDASFSGLARDQLVEGLLAPHDRALGWLLELGLGLLLGQLLRAERLVLRLRLRLGLLVLDDVLGRLDHDEPGRVEAGPAGAAGDLEELARLQDPLPVAVELRQAGEQHGADRHVDARRRGCRCRR